MRRAARWVLLASPLLLLEGLCFAVRPEPLSLLAPWFGPWGGVPLGHSGCTLASVLPVLSWGVGAGIALGVAWLSIARGGTPRRTASAFTWIALLGWGVAGALSVVNTTS